MKVLRTQTIELTNPLPHQCWVRGINPFCFYPEVQVFLFDETQLPLNAPEADLASSLMQPFYVGSIFFYGLGENMADTSNIEVLQNTGKMVHGGLVNFDVLLDIEPVLQKLEVKHSVIFLFAAEERNAKMITDTPLQHGFEYAVLEPE